MALELPGIPNFNVQTPPAFDPLAQRTKQATLSGLLSENALRQQLAPLQVQEQEQRAQQAQIATEMQKIQLQDQKALGKYLQGDPNEEVPTANTPMYNNIATFVGVDPKDPIMNEIRRMGKAGFSGPGLLVQAQGMLQRRNEYNKGTEDQQKIIKANYDTWKDAMGQLFNEKDPSHQSLMLTDMFPRLQDATHLSPELDTALQHLRQNGVQAIPEAYNLVAAQNSALGLSKAGAEASKAATEAAETAAEATGQVTPKMATAQKQKVEVAREEAKVRAEAQQSLLQGSALDQSAQRYLETGQLPAGMRSPGMSAAIINRAAELGGGQNIAANTAAYKANQQSYENVTKTLDTLSAFEQTGLKNLKQFTDLAAKIPDTGVPWLNTPIRKLDEKLVGSSNMAAVNAARAVALREIARVTNDPKLSGQLSDNARQEVENLVPANATFNQIKAVANVLQADMANVHTSLSAQKADIGKRLGLQPVSENPQQNTGGHVIKIGDKQYTYNGSGDTADLKNYTEIKKPK